ncbi:hypothetical protein GUITHDRAFT_144704 [Guillardia theta CCMP2712]|uniref:Uncharacterized protein n=1 Tax=Guillardia theta (strain CCMP2712) TaxID=905079 RepID=L1IPS3_GUITC|nr:hypothetical protein GUITHDRAFT_144704 [Guillardia theta CCMP2712]EKX37884.1 hypothetical protein GUITHDRAFT_144704 [Guillardia theta CCMP2712]|eukprot:XP_005824864.1 hypothetical protein GUITHDRAFT_144704 [Guillardia theta CCMP2712]
MSLSSPRQLAGERREKGVKTILGGSLLHLSLSLQKLPACRTHALPSHDGSILLRSVGFMDPKNFDVSSLLRQPDYDTRLASSAVKEQEAEDTKSFAFDYLEMTGAVAERHARVAKLHTDNFLRSEAERDWEDERSMLVAVDLGSLDLQKPDSFVLPAFQPIAGFTERDQTAAEEGSSHQRGGERRRRWDGRQQQLSEVVKAINRKKWRAESLSERDELQPLKLLSRMTRDGSDASFSSSNPSSQGYNTSLEDPYLSLTSPGYSPAAPLEGSQGPSASSRYLADLYRMLHALVARDKGTRGFICLKDQVSRDAWLLRGALEFLSADFKDLLRTSLDCWQEGGKKKLAQQFDEEGESPGASKTDRMLVIHHLLRWHSKQRDSQLDGTEDGKCVPLWAEIFFLMRCGAADAAASILNDNSLQLSSPPQRRPHAHASSSEHQEFERVVKQLFRQALTQWAEGEKGDEGVVHRLSFSPSFCKGDFLWACNMRLTPESSSMKRFGGLVESFLRQTESDKWHNVVVSLLNDSENNPGEIPRSHKGESESARFKCAINDLPPLFDDVTERLCDHLLLDKAADRLAPSFFLYSNRSNGNLFLDTAVVAQKTLWRLVQDMVWRQLAFVRPDPQLKPLGRNHSKHKSQLHPLSLEHCQTEGVKAVVEGVSKWQGWTSFKVYVKAITSGQNLPGIHPQIKTIVTYNLVQILFLTLQLDKGLLELSKLGGEHEVEAAHIGIALHYYGALQGLEELDYCGQRGDVGAKRDSRSRAESFLRCLVSKMLHGFFLLPPSSPASFLLLLQRALHYCYVFQVEHFWGGVDVQNPEEGESLQGKEEMAEESRLNESCLALLTQLCLLAPVRPLHDAFMLVLEDLAPASSSPPVRALGASASSAGRRRKLLIDLMYEAKVRAAEVCCLRGDLLLHDAALLFYWAEQEGGLNGGEKNFEKFLLTMTALVDQFAVEERCSSRKARSRVMDIASRLVEGMWRYGRGGSTNLLEEQEEEQEGAGGRRQAREVMQWLRVNGHEERARTLLSVFLYTWQSAKAQEVYASGLALEALRELLDLSLSSRSPAAGRALQFAPKIRELLQCLQEGNPELSGNISFLPCLHHGVNAEKAILQVQKIVSSESFKTRALGNNLPAQNLVADSILLAFQWQDPLILSPILTLSCQMFSPPKRHLSQVEGLADMSQASKWARTSNEGEQLNSGMLSALVLDETELLRSVKWHLEELERCAELLVKRNLCANELVVRMRTMKQQQRV